MRISKYESIIADVLSHISRQRAVEDFYSLRKLGFSSKKIINIASKMSSRWNIDKANEALILSRQIKSWMYSAQYVSLAYNISEEEALAKIDALKKDKATSLDGFIGRHGEKTGTTMFEKFQKTSRISSNKIKEDLQSQYGDKWKTEFRQRFRNKSQRCYEYYLLNGLAETKEIAQSLANEYQLKNSGVNIEYYTQRGYQKEEIEDIISIIRSKQRLHPRNRYFLKTKYGDKWFEEYQKTAAKYRLSMEQKGLWIPESELNAWKKYKKEVEYLTRQTTFDNKIDDIHKRSKNFHLDHIYSVKMGFVMNIEPKIIAAPINLRIIVNTHNCSKKEKCGMTIEDLYNKFTIYENQKNN